MVSRPPLRPRAEGGDKASLASLLQAKVSSPSPFARGLLVGMGIAQPALQWHQVRVQQADKRRLTDVLAALEMPWPCAEATLSRLYDAEVVLQDPFLGRVRGRDALLQRLEFLRRTTQLEARWHSVMHVDGMHVAQGEVWVRGPLGLSTRIACACYFEMRQGRIVAQRNYYDRVGTLLSAANLLKKCLDP